jgi:hypothetical protein
MRAEAEIVGEQPEGAGEQQHRRENRGMNLFLADVQVAKTSHGGGSNQVTKGYAIAPHRMR